MGLVSPAVAGLVTGFDSAVVARAVCAVVARPASGEVVPVVRRVVCASVALVVCGPVARTMSAAKGRTACETVVAMVSRMKNGNPDRLSGRVTDSERGYDGVSLPCRNC